MTEIWFIVLFLHLLGATVWVGGHLVLALSVLPAALRARDPQIVQGFEARFERIGLPAFALQIATGLWLAWRVMPDLGAWFDLSDPMGRTIFVKLVCLAASLALALHARLSLIPRLDAATLPALGWHIRAITLVAVLFVFAGTSVRLGGLSF